MSELKNDLYSYHVFLFPFQWQYFGSKYNRKTIEEKTNLEEFCTLLEKSLWKRKSLNIDTVLGFNEYSYFYDFVRDILYDKDQLGYDSTQFKNQSDNFIAHYEYESGCADLTYEIKVETFGLKKTYYLEVDSIILHLYNTGIGVLSFHLNNRRSDQKSKEDILTINQFGRRLWPPFFSINHDLVGNKEQYAYNDFVTGLKGVKNVELASHITLSIADREDYNQYTYQSHFNDGVFRLPNFIKQLFKGVPIVENQKKSETRETQVLVSPVLDDRMFVVCWYGNNEIVDEIRNRDGDKLKAKEINGQYVYTQNEWLYKYAFVDGGGMTCQNQQMSEKFIRECYNARWLNYGTLFAATRYSFVCLTQPLDDPGFRKYSAFIVNHVQTMYYKMVELCLVQRACILRFSDEVSDISSMKVSDKKLLPMKVASLYKQYIRFVNKIYFREITPQEQGIELYELLQEKMNIPNYVEDLDKEIEELHNYLKMEEQSEQNKELTALTKIAAIFLPPTLVVGVLGMNSLEETYKNGLSTFDFLFNIWLLIAGIIIGLTIAYWRNLKSLYLNIFKS